MNLNIDPPSKVLLVAFAEVARSVAERREQKGQRNGTVCRRGWMPLRLGGGRGGSGSARVPTLPCDERRPCCAPGCRAHPGRHPHRTTVEAVPGQAVRPARAQAPRGSPCVKRLSAAKSRGVQGSQRGRGPTNQPLRGRTESVGTGLGNLPQGRRGGRTAARAVGSSQSCSRDASGGVLLRAECAPADGIRKAHQGRRCRTPHGADGARAADACAAGTTSWGAPQKERTGRRLPNVA